MDFEEVSLSEFEFIFVRCYRRKQVGRESIEHDVSSHVHFSSSLALRHFLPFVSPQLKNLQFIPQFVNTSFLLTNNNTTCLLCVQYILPQQNKPPQNLEPSTSALIGECHSLHAIQWWLMTAGDQHSPDPCSCAQLQSTKNLCFISQKLRKNEATMRCLYPPTLIHITQRIRSSANIGTGTASMHIADLGNAAPARPSSIAAAEGCKMLPFCGSVYRLIGGKRCTYKSPSFPSRDQVWCADLASMA